MHCSLIMMKQQYMLLRLAARYDDVEATINIMVGRDEPLLALEEIDSIWMIPRAVKIRSAFRGLLAGCAACIDE
jgi:hypothetical protein